MIGFKSDLGIRMSAAKIIFEAAFLIRGSKVSAKHSVIGEHFRQSFNGLFDYLCFISAHFGKRR